VDCGEVPFLLTTKPKPSTETGAAHIICHPELAKDLTAGQPALGHHSPFSELTAPPDEPSVPITCRLKRTSRLPREILRRLRMTTFGAPFSLLRPICKLLGNGKSPVPPSRAGPIFDPPEDVAAKEVFVRSVSYLQRALVADGVFSQGGTGLPHSKTLARLRSRSPVHAQQSPSRFGKVSSSG